MLLKTITAARKWNGAQRVYAHTNREFYGLHCAMCIEGNLLNPNWNETAKIQKEYAMHAK